MKNIALLPAVKIKRNLPLNYKPGELDFCKEEFEYQTYEVNKMVFNNAIVNAKGFLYSNSFKVVKLSLLDPKIYTETFTLKHYFKKVFLKRKTRILENCLLCFDEWGNNHYHFFCDTLPRIFSIRDTLNQYTLLLPDNAYIKNIAVSLLQRLKLEPKAIYFIKDKELVRCKNLTLITHATLTGYINDKLMKQISESLQHYISIDLNLKNESRKIYISRAKAKYRKVLNEDEVIALVKRFGYEVIDFDDYNLQQQIALTATSKVMVAIHGAGLTNMLYLPKNAYVLEFRRNKIYHNQCYWHLADALKLNYLYLFGEPDNKDLVIEGNGCNLTINLGKLEEALSLIERKIS